MRAWPFRRKYRAGEGAFYTVGERRSRRCLWRSGRRRGAPVLLRFLAGVEDGGGPSTVEDVHVDLGQENLPNLVNKVRNEEIKEGGGRKWRGDAVLHRNRSSTAAAGGGTASTSGGSLGALGWSGLGQSKEERVEAKMGVVGGGGVRLEGRIEEGKWWWHFRPLMATNGREKVG